MLWVTKNRALFRTWFYRSPGTIKTLNIGIQAANAPPIDAEHIPFYRKNKINQNIRWMVLYSRYRGT
jgi:hypothetical protein